MIRYAIDSHTGKLPPDLRMTLFGGDAVYGPMAIICQPLSEDAIHALEAALEAAKSALADHQMRKPHGPSTVSETLTGWQPCARPAKRRGGTTSGSPGLRCSGRSGAEKSTPIRAGGTMSKLHRWALLDKAGKNRGTCEAILRETAADCFLGRRDGLPIPKGWTIVDRGPVEDDTLALAADPAPVPEATLFTTKNEDGITINGQFYWVHPKVQEYIYALEEVCYGPDARGIKAEVDRLKAELAQAEAGLVSGPTWGQVLKDARVQAAREERERIIAYITDPHNNILWIVPGSSHIHAIHADPRVIRAAIAKAEGR